MRRSRKYKYNERVENAVDATLKAITGVETRQGEVLSTMAQQNKLYKRKRTSPLPLKLIPSMTSKLTLFYFPLFNGICNIE